MEQASTKQKPSIGRIVHFVLPNGEHRPAMVVRVCPEEFPNNPEDHTGLNLQVFLDGTNDNEAYRGMVLPCPIDLLHGTMWYASAQYGYAGPGPIEREIDHGGEAPKIHPQEMTGVIWPPAGTWHWPETV